MVAIKTHFDGKKIVVPKELRGAPPGEVIVVIERSEKDSKEKENWSKAQEAAFTKVWDNDKDAIYDDL